MTGEGDQTAVTDLEFLRSDEQQTPGGWDSVKKGSCSLDRQRKPVRVHADPQPLLRGGPGWSASVLGGIADSNKFEPLDEAKVRQVDHHGGFTAAAGHALYTARNYPRQYWNRAAFVAEPTGHLVATFIIREDGSGFRSKKFLEPGRQR